MVLTVVASDQEAEKLVTGACAVVLRGTVFFGRGLGFPPDQVVRCTGDVGELVRLLGAVMEHPGLGVLESLEDESVLVGQGAAVGRRD